jgi:hypothetical protein
MEFPLSDTSAAHNERYRYWWNYHWGTVSDHRSSGSEEWISSDLTQGFHDYAVEWSPDAMDFYFDGGVRGRVTDRGAVAESSGMYIILNFAVGGWPGSPPSWPAGGDRFEIEWVRVWELEEPAELIDLGNLVGGGDGRAGSTAPFVGLHPALGSFSSDLGLDLVEPGGANPRPVAAAGIDSVFLMVADTSTVNTRGTRFSFPPGDSSAASWDLISNAVEADGPRGFLRLGPRGVFRRGIGIHASSGVTFDLAELRARHGDRRVAFFSAFAGEGSLQGGGSVNNHVILAGEDGRLLHSRSVGPHRDDGRLIEMELPLDARFLTLATGSAGDGNGQDHGVFANAFITPCSVSDPLLCPSPADEILVFSGSTWRYLDAGSAPPGDWIEHGFPAGSWRSGAAQLGYGDGDEFTTVGFGGDPDRKRITTYFRRLFTVEDAAGVAALSLRLLRDDGAAVYLNGVEVLRSNLPPGTIDDGTLASASVSDEDEATWVVAAVDPCLLEEGTNIIAAEVHQASAASTDVSFDLVLAAERDEDGAPPCGPVFIRGDCNGDGEVAGSVTDAVFFLQFNFLGGPEPGCLAACDSDGDGAATGQVTDAVHILQFSFLGGPAPPAPFPLCGPGDLPGDAALGCKAPPAACGG